MSWAYCAPKSRTSTLSVAIVVACTIFYRSINGKSRGCESRGERAILSFFLVAWQRVAGTLSRPNPALDATAVAAAHVDGVDEVERGEHPSGRVAVVAPAGLDAVEPVVDEQV